MKHQIASAGLFLATALLTTTSHATPLLFSDTYGVGSPDVIGNVNQFDLRSVELVTLNHTIPGLAEFNIRMNYNNGDLALNPFTAAGISLRPGDLLFKGSTGFWGVALATDGHGGVTAGSLYQANGFLTAQTVLGNPSGVTYRPTEAVWFNPNGAVQQGTGSVLTTSLGGPEVNVNVKFVTSTAFLNDISSGYQLLMATATCGNDILRTNIDVPQNIPEPASGLLMLLGLPAAVWLRRSIAVPA